MIDIEKNSKEHFDDKEIVCLCCYKDNLVLVPCDNAMSGYYPRYEEAVVLKENVELNYIDLDGILYDPTFKMDITTRLVVNSWDAFQPTENVGFNDYLKFIGEITALLQDD